MDAGHSAAKRNRPEGIKIRRSYGLFSRRLRSGCSKRRSTGRVSAAVISEGSFTAVRGSASGVIWASPAVICKH